MEPGLWQLASVFEHRGDEMVEKRYYLAAARSCGLLWYSSR